MLETYSVSFFGHRRIERFLDLEDRVVQLIQNLIETNDFVEFLVGRNGDFDQLVSSSIRTVKRKIGNDRCFHTLVLPYETAEFRNNQQAFSEYYDAVEFFPPAKTTHFKAAVQARNRHMVDRSDLIVFYLNCDFGGAFQTYQYASRQEKQILNLNQ